MIPVRPDGGRLAGRATVHSRHPGSVRPRTAADGGSGQVRSDDGALDWSWPPYAPIDVAGAPFDTPDWAPASVVWHPRLRVGRWTLLYRRSA
jgi:hypothetical protein